MSDSILIRFFIYISIGFCIFKLGVIEILIKNISRTAWVIIMRCILALFIIEIIRIEKKLRKSKKQRRLRKKAEKFFEEETERLKPLLKKNPELWLDKTNKLRDWKQQYAPNYFY